jgi:hypothetical protein
MISSILMASIAADMLVVPKYIALIPTSSSLQICIFITQWTSPWTCLYGLNSCPQPNVFLLNSCPGDLHHNLCRPTSWKYLWA